MDQIFYAMSLNLFHSFEMDQKRRSYIGLDKGSVIDGDGDDQSGM